MTGPALKLIRSIKQILEARVHPQEEIRGESRPTERMHHSEDPTFMVYVGRCLRRMQPLIGTQLLTLLYRQFLSYFKLGISSYAPCSCY